jgi:CDP-diacylglycerol--serine O-phosphatidyltransferase
MVSNLRYYSFKGGIDRKERVPFVAILVAVLAFVLVSIHPSHVLFVLFLAYAVSGPVVTLVQLRRRRAERKTQPSAKGCEEGRSDLGKSQPP